MLIYNSCEHSDAFKKTLHSILKNSCYVKGWYGRGHMMTRVGGDVGDQGLKHCWGVEELDGMGLE